MKAPTNQNTRSCLLIRETIWFLFLAVCVPLSHSFVLKPQKETHLFNEVPSSCRPSLFCLNATKKKKTKRAKTAQSQGFGSTSSKAAKPKKKGGRGLKSALKDDKDADADFKFFPRLDPQVTETLVPSTELLFHEPGVLPREVYDHLHRVYGFSNFAYNQINHKEAEPVAEQSLQDLLLADGASNNDILGDIGLPVSNSKSSDLDDLIASATGGSPSTKSSSTTQDLSPFLEQLRGFERFRVLHFDPLLLAIDDFFSEEECDRYVAMSSGGSSDKILQSRSPTVGKDSSSRSQRTSTTWYHMYKNTPELMAKASKLLGFKSIEQFEEPQTVRYRRNEKFTWHLDALGPDENRPKQGGQRIATLLVYLSDLVQDEGGATMFRDLRSPEGERLAVRPQKGSALLFFPAASGIPNTPFDIRTLHCGEAISAQAKNDKWIAQLWACENNYVPTAPSTDNLHSKAVDAIAQYCETNAV